eukprot:1143367-Pelagomonas_calceolata.AAC.2
MKSMPCSFVLALLCALFEEHTKQTNETYRSISDLIDIFGAVGTVEQAEQPNYLAEVSSMQQEGKMCTDDFVQSAWFETHPPGHAKQESLSQMASLRVCHASCQWQPSLHQAAGVLLMKRCAGAHEHGLLPVAAAAAAAAARL